MSPLYYEYVFAAFAFLFGSIVGSFLNVCIYRMPLELSVNDPKRSFCPHCKELIPWYRNLPILSWVLLRGRCAVCKQPISIRYWLVELLTGTLFLWVWLRFPWDVAIAYWVFGSLLIAATFIDFDHFIIPDEITWGGTAAGLVLSFVFPKLMGEEVRMMSVAWSLLGATTGFAILWMVVELGKKAFGKKKIVLEKTEPFVWERHGDDAELRIGEEVLQWSELFSRESDQLLLTCTGATADGKPIREGTLTFHYNRLLADGQEWALEKLEVIKGNGSELVIPREAMGFGDVKFIAAIGAFLGWKAVLFTIFSASVIGALVGVATIAMGKREWSAKIPFGPYLSLGALIWVATGEPLLTWYWQLMAGQA